MSENQSRNFRKDTETVLNLEKRIRPDPRLKYFSPADLQIRNELLSILRKERLFTEANRFCDCGKRFNILKCDNGKHDTTVFGFPYRCELRICARCSRIRANAVQKEIEEILKQTKKTKTHRFSFLTLTQRVSDLHPLTPENLRLFMKNVRALVNEYFSKEDNCGAIAVLEVGRGNNLHAHILVFGPYVPQPELSKKWLELTGDSFIVHIEAVRDQKIAVNYLLKYLAKPPSFDTSQGYVAFLKAIKGVRRLHRFGILYGFKIDLKVPLVCPYCKGRLIYDGTADYLFAEMVCHDYWKSWETTKGELN